MARFAASSDGGTRGRAAIRPTRPAAQPCWRVIFQRGKGRLLGLARRPLLLTLMARLRSEKRRELPEKRIELYSEVLDLLLRNWDARRCKVDEQGRPRQDQSSLSEYLAVGPDQVRAVLEHLAFEAHRD